MIECIKLSSVFVNSSSNFFQLEAPETHKEHQHHRVEEILKKTQHISTSEDYEIDDAEDEEPKRITKKLGTMKKDHDDDEIDDKEDETPERHHHTRKHSPKTINIILGLCCGILVFMLIAVVVMVFRRRQFAAQPRVVIADSNDDREHLIQMQKSGFENPTYKFFYY